MRYGQSGPYDPESNNGSYLNPASHLYIENGLDKHYADNFPSIQSDHLEMGESMRV